MKAHSTGWVIYTPAFQFNGPPRILDWTYSGLRKEAIAKLGNHKEWRDLRRKYNYQCVRADLTITI